MLKNWPVSDGTTQVFLIVGKRNVKQFKPKIYHGGDNIQYV